LNHQQFVDLVRAIGAVTELAEFEIIGSQAIHGSLPPGKIKGVLALSPDLDAILAHHRQAGAAMRLLGLTSRYDKDFKVHVDVVSQETAIFPAGWRERRIAFRGPSPSPLVWCPEATDIAAAKIGVFRAQDREFVESLLAERIVDPDLLITRVGMLERTPDKKKETAIAWIKKRRAALDL
jgi:hypothetical protein